MGRAGSAQLAEASLPVAAARRCVAALVVLVDVGDLGEAGLANVGRVRSSNCVFLKQSSKQRVGCASNLTDGHLGIFGSSPKFVGEVGRWFVRRVNAGSPGTPMPPWGDESGAPID